MYTKYSPFTCSFADEPDQPRLEPLKRLLGRGGEQVPKPVVVVLEPEKFEFGKYKGQYVQDVAREDAPYLDWLLQQNWLKKELREVVARARASIKKTVA